MKHPPLSRYPVPHKKAAKEQEMKESKEVKENKEVKEDRDTKEDKENFATPVATPARRSTKRVNQEQQVTPQFPPSCSVVSCPSLLASR